MREIDPKTTNRAKAFELWMKAAMPMVTMTKTFDISRLCRIAKRKGTKLNMLMCYAIVKAASSFKEFYMLPVGDKLMEYDNLAILVVNLYGDDYLMGGNLADYYKWSSIIDEVYNWNVKEYNEAILEEHQDSFQWERAELYFLT